jgi:Pyruvate/2-oxoacid:ferredoxin oxidoreductase delta subunit
MKTLLSPLLGALILALMVYAGWLTSDWGSLLASAPAILVVMAVVGGLAAGVIFFGTVEPLTVMEPAPARDSSLRPRNGRPTAPDARVVYNQRKIRGVLSGIGEVPEKHTRKKKRPPQVAQVLEPACTGCGVCIPFCPADCIEVEAAGNWPSRSLPPVRTRYDECVGCGICVRVCEMLAWDAAVMRPTAAIEREEGIVIHDSFPQDMDGFRSGF